MITQFESIKEKLALAGSYKIAGVLTPEEERFLVESLDLALTALDRHSVGGLSMKQAENVLKKIREMKIEN